jgi:hypothetical protein
MFRRLSQRIILGFILKTRVAADQYLKCKSLLFFCSVCNDCSCISSAQKCTTIYVNNNNNNNNNNSAVFENKDENLVLIKLLLFFHLA